MRAPAVLALGLACLAPAYAEDTFPTFGSPAHFTEASGAAVYGAVCASCHMPQGQGAIGAGAYPALAGDPRIASARYVAMRVLYGRGAMPPLGRYLSDDQVAAVVAYVQAQFGGLRESGPGPADIAALR